MKKKNKKKASKEAFKFLVNNKLTLGKIRDLLGMQEYDDDDVKETFHRCIKKFLKEDTIDGEEAYWRSKFAPRQKERDEYDDELINPIQIDPDDKKKVRRVSPNKQIASVIDALGSIR